MADAVLKRVKAGVLDVAYEQSGSADGPPVILLHGFPYDVRAYDAVAPHLARAGHLVLVPYLRGYGPTRFLGPAIPRSGEQAALGCDLVAFLDALALPRAVLAGYDWGGRAACVVAALWPERVAGLLSVTGYNIQDIAAGQSPQAPEQEMRLWYQFYLHGDRGRAGLIGDRDAFCHLLWRLWSPEWRFGDATFARSAAAFTNPDFVDVVVHSYRHRFGLVEGDPAYRLIEQRLAARPKITVPTAVLHGGSDGVSPATHSAAHAKHFTGPYAREVLPGIGHNVPQEAPEVFAKVVLALASETAPA